MVARSLVEVPLVVVPASLVQKWHRPARPTDSRENSEGTSRLLERRRVPPSVRLTRFARTGPQILERAPGPVHSYGGPPTAVRRLVRATHSPMYSPAPHPRTDAGTPRRRAA